MTADHPTLRGRRGVCIGIAVVLAVTIAVHPVAAARHPAQRHASHGAHESRHGKHESNAAPPYAAIVLDANSGHVLHSANADELRHPASLTKIMTLYLLFERLDAGKLRLDSALPVSEHAAMQAPTKLGLKPGQSIEVEDAIRGLVTKSANDAAVAVAEAIGGSEREFADMMTAKAHAMGMNRSIYRNASGLPNDEQVTTARDQASLGRAIQERFPRYYRYFSTPSFTYRGQTMRNHNQLLGRVEGMDGIKTGYTQASGFNLVASVRRNNRHIVSVVLGGTSAGARDARMRSLIEEYIVAAAPQKTMVAGTAGSKVSGTHSAEVHADARNSGDPTAPGTRGIDSRPADGPAAPTTYSIASFGRPVTWPAPSAAPPISPSGAAASSQPVFESTATTAPVPAATNPAPAGKQATDPIRPIQVRTLKVKMAPSQVATLAVSPPPQAAVQDTSRGGAAPSIESPSHVAIAEEPKRERDLIAETIRQTAPPQSAPRPPAPSLHSGWIIQVGAFDVEREARERLSIVQAKAGRILKGASPFTEAVVMGDKTLYRARFAGIQKDEAEAICRQLKRNDIACMTIKN